MLNVLLVEDNDRVARSFIENVRLIFDDEAPAVNRCDNFEDALEILDHHPCYDVVVLDRNLDGEGGLGNDDGASVAKHMAKRGYPTKPWLASAVTKDYPSEIAEEIEELYVKAVPPSPTPDIIEEMMLLGTENREKRLQRSSLMVSPKLDNLKENGLRAVHRLSSNTADETFHEFVSNGYKVLAVQPNSAGYPMGLPFFVWLKEAKEGVFLEVYGQPSLFAFAENTAKALEALNEVILTTFFELENEADLGPMLQRAKSFLTKVYESEFSNLSRDDTK